MRIMFLNHTPANPNGSAGHERIQNLLRSYCSPGTELDLCYTDDYEGAGVMRAMRLDSAAMRAIRKPPTIRMGVMHSVYFSVKRSALQNVSSFHALT